MDEFEDNEEKKERKLISVTFVAFVFIKNW